MDNWKHVFGLIELRKISNFDHEIIDKIRDGSLLNLTAEIAIDAGTYQQLPTWEQATARAAAVGLTADKAVVAGLAAARLWGIEVLGVEREVELYLPGSARPKGKSLWPNGVLYRNGYLDPRHIEEIHGLRVTKRVHTLTTIARYQDLCTGVVAIDSARRAWPQLTTARLHQDVALLGRFHGSPKVRQAIDLSISNSGSTIESKARFLLWQAQLPEVESVEAQVVFQSQADQTTYQVDLLINRWLIVEIDGITKYHGRYGITPEEAIRRERAREKILQNQGYPVLRVTASDLKLRPDKSCVFLDQVVGALRNFAKPSSLIRVGA